MLGRIRNMAVTTIALALSASAFPAASPAPRIVAIGDLHGDFAAWRQVAQAAGLIGADGHWSGGRTVFVQTGDIVDRADDSLRIIADLQRLEKEAAAAGGRTIVLIGNHEAMLMTGDFRYVTPGELKPYVDRKSAERRLAYYEANRPRLEAAYKELNGAASPKAVRAAWLAATPLGLTEYRAAWSAQGEMGRWTLGHAAVARVDDTLFVHGGLSPAYAALGIDEVNRRVREALAAGGSGKGTIVTDTQGPLWYRGLDGLKASPDDAEPAPVARQLDLILGALKARRIVVGHTPRLQGVSVSEDGRLAHDDSGISRAYGGLPGYIEIIGGQAVGHNVPRTP